MNCQCIRTSAWQILYEIVFFIVLVSKWTKTATNFSPILFNPFFTFSFLFCLSENLKKVTFNVRVSEKWYDKITINNGQKYNLVVLLPQFTISKYSLSSKITIDHCTWLHYIETETEIENTVSSCLVWQW